MSVVSLCYGKVSDSQSNEMGNLWISLRQKSLRRAVSIGGQCSHDGLNFGIIAP